VRNSGAQSNRRSHAVLQRRGNVEVKEGETKREGRMKRERGGASEDKEGIERRVSKRFGSQTQRKNAPDLKSRSSRR
jgi:hypothetical protein